MRQTADGSSDHYEALQLSPNADSETVDRVYRILAKRYHPDNQQTGDATKFGMIADAHRVLSDPEQRAAYDARHEEHRGAVLKIFDEASRSNPFAADQRIFEAILSLLYAVATRIVAAWVSFNWSECLAVLQSTSNSMFGISGKNSLSSDWKMGYSLSLRMALTL